ncbi:MAG: T9SS type A sorting domain-containing protein [Bacteroidales bacterium]
MKTIMKPIFALLFILTSLSGFAQYTIDGTVLYHNNPNKPIPNVQVVLKDLAGNVLQTTTTNQAGQYSFANVPAGTYTLSASTNIPAGGITLQDANLILLNILGFYSFTPIQKLAADVDGNGVITWNDYFTVVFGWFLYGYPFPAGNWVFTNATVVAGLKDGNNMGGSSSADVNGSYVPNLTKAELVMETSDKGQIEAAANEYISLPVYANRSLALSGFVLYLEYPSELISIENVKSPLNNLRYVAEDGLLKVVWAETEIGGIQASSDRPLFTIEARTLPAFTEGSQILLTPVAGSHVVDNDGNVPGDFKLGLQKVIYKPATEQLLVLYPNPVGDRASLQLNLDTDSQVKLEVFASGGQKVMNAFHETLKAGIHTLTFDSHNLPGGVYYYQCTISNNQSSKTLRGSFVK